MLPDWMRGINRAINQGIRTGDTVTIRETGEKITITDERRYRIWEEEAREIGREIAKEMPYVEDMDVRVAEEADNHVPYGTYERWMLYTQGLLWQMDEFEDGLRSAMDDPYDAGRLPAYLLYFKAEELIYEGISN